MIINKSEKRQAHFELDLTGQEGNAFVLLGYARKLSLQLGLDWHKVQDEMTSDDYEHLVQTFDKYFGKYVILYR